MSENGGDQTKGLTRKTWQAIGVAVSCVAATVFLSVTGPFNTFGLGSFLERLLYWGGLVAASFGLVLLIKPLVHRLALKDVYRSEAVTIVVFSLVFTPVVIGWTDAMFPAGASTRPSVGAMFLYILVICIVFNVARFGLPFLVRAADDTSELTPEAPAAPRFQRRLPETFSGTILRLSGDGHYVNVLTTQGPFDVRIRLSDAVDEMDGQDGFLVHRSHWVARHAVKDKCRERGRPVLVLTNGDTVPVGAKYRPQLEDAGIL